VFEVGRRVEIKLHLLLPVKTEASSQFNRLTSSSLQKELPEEPPTIPEEMAERKLLLVPGTDLGPPSLTQSLRRTF